MSEEQATYGTQAPVNGTAVKAVVPPVIAQASTLKIVRAEKRAGKLRIAVTGPSGSGKSYSSLLIAAGIVGKESVRADGRAKILVVDTENASMADYGMNANGSWPVVPFDMISLRPEYTVAKYLEAARLAEQEGYEVLVIDSLTHAWAGQGGIREKKDRLDASGKGNSFTNWGKVDPEFNRFRDMILNNRVHLIGTMRSKTEYAVDPATNKPSKLGMAPVMRDGLEYEFTVVFDLDAKHQAEVSKHRTGDLYRERGLFVPSVDTGRELINWRMAGGQEVESKSAQQEPAAAPAQAQDNGNGRPTPEQLLAIKDLAAKHGTTLQAERISMGMKGIMTGAQAAEIIMSLKMRLAAKPGEAAA